MAESIIDVRGASERRDAEAGSGDPVLTEVIRNGLNAAAEQMKVTLCRTAFSPVIYEMIDFAAGIYDTDCRMLAQARAAPQFLGTLSYCLEAALERLGGLESMEPGDVIWSTDGYDNGSHSQDAVVIVPAFDGDRLVGFAVTKAHHLDIAATDPYCTNTTDYFQEGVIFPAVKLFAAGVQQRDIYRTILANSRLPKALEGDMNAQINACVAGNTGLLRLLNRYGSERFWESVELMLNHGEASMRAFLQSIPDGRYVGPCLLDDNGLDHEPIEFTVAVEVSGSEVTIDFSEAPPQQPGPVNTPLPTTVATARLSVMGLLGGVDLPNEGHFRPINVRVARRTIFFPEPPAPIFLYHGPAEQANEAIQRAMSSALPGSIPAGSGGDLCGLVLWGTREQEGFWTTAVDHPAGQGATAHGDGGSPLMIMPWSGIRSAPTEVIEARDPILVERCELAADSAGAGRFRGGCGVDTEYRLLEDALLTSIVGRTRLAPWGLSGGLEGRPNSLVVQTPAGRVERYGTVTRLQLPAGSVLTVESGGGGGYGSASDRKQQEVEGDIEDGYVTVEHAQSHYPAAVDLLPPPARVGGANMPRVEASHTFSEGDEVQ